MYNQLTSDNARKQYIASKIETCDNWLYKAILAIFKRQTQDEQSSDNTKHANQKGFNGADAYILSQYAKWIERHGRLSDKQKAVARKRMVKYAGQLVVIAKQSVKE